jgi:hypothetical protein
MAPLTAFALGMFLGVNVGIAILALMIAGRER